MNDRISNLTMNVYFNRTFNYINDRNGRDNMAIVFDGNNTIYGPNCAPTMSIKTIALWINVQQVNGTATVFVINTFYSLKISQNTIDLLLDTLMLNASLYRMNEWTHLAITLDAQNSYLYVNGTEAWKSANAMEITRPMTCDFGVPGDYEFYLDDLFFYNRALNATEILAVMNAKT